MSLKDRYIYNRSPPGLTYSLPLKAAQSINDQQTILGSDVSLPGLGWKNFLAHRKPSDIKFIIYNDKPLNRGTNSGTRPQQQT